MSQTEFAPLIGRSFQMLQLYERGQDVPPDVVEKLKTIAVQAGRGDLALALAGEKNFQVESVFHPGETFIDASKTTVRPHRVSPLDRRRYHAMLDEIFDSGDPDAITAVVPNIELFTKWVRSRSPQSGAVPTPKKVAKK